MEIGDYEHVERNLEDKLEALAKAVGFASQQVHSSDERGPALKWALDQIEFSFRHRLPHVFPLMKTESFEIQDCAFPPEWKWAMLHGQLLKDDTQVYNVLWRDVTLYNQHIARYALVSLDIAHSKPDPKTFQIACVALRRCGNDDVAEDFSMRCQPTKGTLRSINPQIIDFIAQGCKLFDNEMGNTGVEFVALEVKDHKWINGIADLRQGFRDYARRYGKTIAKLMTDHENELLPEIDHIISTHEDTTPESIYKEHEDVVPMYG